jgi:interleukin-like EMT inducer protein
VSVTPAAVTPPRPRRGAGTESARRVRHALLVGLFFLGVMGVYTYPLVLNPRNVLRGGHGDYLTETSMVTWNALQTFAEPGRLFEVPFYYPYSNGVAYQQSAFFTGLLAAPLLAVGIEPIVAVNLLLILELTASGMLTYLLAYAITGSVIPSLVAGTLFAFHPNRMDHLGQFTYQQAVLFPLIVWAVYRFVGEGARRHLWLAVVALWAQALSSIYNGYALLLLVVGLTVGLLALRPDRLTGTLALRVSGATLVLGLALAPFMWPYLGVHRELGFQRTLAEGDVFGMDFLSILDPGEFSRFYRHRLMSLGRPEGGLFPGFMALVLAGAAIVLYGRGDRDQPPLPPWARRARWLLLGLAAVALGAIALALAFGRHRPSIGLLRVPRVRDLTLAVNALPVLALAWVALEARRRVSGALHPREWMLVLLFLGLLAYLLCLAPTLILNREPWGVTLFRWVYLYLPGGSAFRAPGRWSLVFVLPFALLAGLGVRALAERLPRRWSQVVPATVLAVMLVELSPVPLPWHLFPRRPAVYDWLRAEPGDFAILQLPIHEKGADAWAMLWATYHGKRLVNGHGGFALPNWEELVAAADARDPERLASAIRTIYPVRYILVHRNLGLGRTWEPMWELMRAGLVPALDFAHAFGADEVYRVTPTPETGALIRRHFSSDFVRHHPQATYTVRLAGEDTDVQRRVEVRFNGRLLETLGESTRADVVLTPPFPVADRNELTFQHVYAVPAALTRTAPYRIGSTGRYSPVDLVVGSVGHEGGGGVSVRVNGLELTGPRGRGYWVAALDPTDGRVLDARSFDAPGAGSEPERLAGFIEGWPAGTIVVAAAMDAPESQLTDRVVKALRSIGGHADLRGTSGCSHVLIGARGATPGQAVEASGPRPTRVVVGKERPLGVRLEAFDLR